MTPLSASAVLVPPVRLGRLLQGARLAHDESLLQIARRSGLAYDEAWFAQVEAGRVPLDEPVVRWLAALYGIDAGDLVPVRSRLVIDLDEGWVAAGDTRVAVDSSAPDGILTNYLALVYLLRDLPTGSPISLREVDVAVLADALARSRRDVRVRLGRLLAAEPAELARRARHLRRRLVVPLAGILVGCTAVGGLLLVRAGRAGADGVTPPAMDRGSASAVRSQPVEIGQAVVLEAGGVQQPR